MRWLGVDHDFQGVNVHVQSLGGTPNGDKQVFSIYLWKSYIRPRSRSGRIHQSKLSRGPLQTPAILSTRLAGRVCPSTGVQKVKWTTHFAASHQNQHVPMKSPMSSCESGETRWPREGALGNFRGHRALHEKKWDNNSANQTLLRPCSGPHHIHDPSLRSRHVQHTFQGWWEKTGHRRKLNACTYILQVRLHIACSGKMFALIEYLFARSKNRSRQLQSWWQLRRHNKFDPNKVWLTRHNRSSVWHTRCITEQ